jgi:hypothetical protein
MNYFFFFICPSKMKSEKKIGEKGTGDFGGKGNMLG